MVDIVRARLLNFRTFQAFYSIYSVPPEQQVYECVGMKYGDETTSRSPETRENSRWKL
jgi:hypothetical protein